MKITIINKWIAGNCLTAILLLIATVQLCACNREDNPNSGMLPGQQNDSTIQETMNILITTNGSKIHATLNNSEAAKDFASLLPLSLTLNDYNNTEKVSNLSRRLNTSGSPSGYDPELGDITYFAPWGNLAIFYKDFGFANGLIKLGEITEGIGLLQVPGSLEVKIELVQ